jgi:ankyrin repeat protein
MKRKRNPDSARAAQALEQMTGGEPSPASPIDLSYQPPYVQGVIPRQANKGYSPFAWGCGITLGIVAAIGFVIFLGIALVAYFAEHERAAKRDAEQQAASAVVQQEAKKQKELDRLAANEADSAGMTQLHRAALTGNASAARRLLEHGADVNAVSKMKWTPLHIAAWHGNAEVAEILIAAGANVNATGDRNRTPLMMAQQLGTPDVVAVLQRHGAK